MARTARPRPGDRLRRGLDTVATGASEPRARSPHLAAFLSFLWPGLGQWYGGRTRAALLFGLPVLGIALLLLIQAAGGIGQVAALLLSPSSALTIVILIGLLAAWRLLAIADSLTIGGITDPFRHRATLTTFTILTVLVVATDGLIGYTAYAFYDASSRIFVNEVSPEETAGPSQVGGSPAPSDDYVAAPIATPATTTDRINILLTGVDSAAERTTALTDTLLVASIDPETADV